MGIATVGGDVVVQGHHQDGVTLLVGGCHVIGADVPAAAHGAVVNRAFAVAVLVIGAVPGTRDVGVAIHFLQQGYNLVGVGGLIGDGILVGDAAGVGPLIGNGIIIGLVVNNSLCLGSRHTKHHEQGCNHQPENVFSLHNKVI